MKRKYLDDAGITDRWDTWDLGENGPERIKKYKKIRKETGVDPREIWNLDYTFYCWLYERLAAYKPNCKRFVDEKQYKFQNNIYTQEEMIDMMLEKLEDILKADSHIIGNRETEEDEILELFVKTIKSLWT